MANKKVLFLKNILTVPFTISLFSQQRALWCPNFSNPRLFKKPYVLNLSFKSDVDAVKYGLVNIRQFQIHQGLVSKEVSNCGNRLSTLDQVPNNKKTAKSYNLTSFNYVSSTITSPKTEMMMKICWNRHLEKKSWNSIRWTYFWRVLVIWNPCVDQDLLKHLTDLQNTIGTQLAVASSNVYPQFVRLALTWQGFQVLISYYV